MAKKTSQSRKRAPVDEHAARELELYIENDFELVGAENSQGKAIERVGVTKTANELGAEAFRGGTELFVFAVDAHGHVSIAVAGAYSLEHAERLVKAAEGVRRQRAQ